MGDQKARLELMLSILQTLNQPSESEPSYMEAIYDFEHEYESLRSRSDDGLGAVIELLDRVREALRVIADSTDALRLYKDELFGVAPEWKPTRESIDRALRAIEDLVV